MQLKTATQIVLLCTILHTFRQVIYTFKCLKYWTENVIKPIELANAFTTLFFYVALSIFFYTLYKKQ
jgi:hypothetical protein